MAPKVIEQQTPLEEMAAPAEDCGYAYPVRTITVETNEFRMFNPILTEEPGPQKQISFPSTTFQPSIIEIQKSASSCEKEGGQAEEDN